ncbi:hypothetical protein FHR33_000456 [Nonomuraea dietziae]|uniref:Uncharacterized protein n=1 Tax=Nonomuraea dietziae TaxID=65515 RepID=A0A7W5Y4W0_9ACTN|nr:hypothetical protein [Nonomuraea dietziae]
MGGRGHRRSSGGWLADLTDRPIRVARWTPSPGTGAVGGT